MSNEVILNLSFDNQTVTDLTGKWTLDGTPNATYEQIDGRDGYSIVTGSLGRCIVLNAVDQNAVYNEYTVDFDMFVKSTYTSDYYIYTVIYMWSLINPGSEYSGEIGNVLNMSLKIGGSEPVGTTNYSPIGRWVHVTFTSGPTEVDDQYCTTVYVDGVKLIDRTEINVNNNPFALSQQIIPLARDTDAKLMPNGPGICLNTFKVVTGIHIPDQNPAISLLNLSRVFNNFCTWLKRQLSTVAFTGSYNDLSNKPTISTVNDGTLTIQQNGTNVQTFTANASTNKTANIQCVDLSTAQTIGGTKTFSANGCIFWKQIKINHNLEYGKNNPPSQSAYHNLMFTDANDWCGSYIENVTDTNGNSTLTFYVRNTNETNSRVYLKCGIDGSFSMYPISNNVWDLGTSTNKWKSFNGINPGALSLPSSSYINVDTTDWDLTCSNGQLGSFTPTADGWLMLHVNNSGTNVVNFWIIGGVLRFNSKSTINNVDNKNFNMFTIPVTKGSTYNIYGHASEYVAGRSIAYCRFMPCQGNV